MDVAWKPLRAKQTGGAVEDLPAPGVEVCLGYAGHVPNLKRTFLLDKEAARRDGEGKTKTNDPSF